MEFKTVQDAFNHYRNMEITDLEARAEEINKEIETNPNANIDSFNIELEGILQAKINKGEKGSTNNRNFNPIASLDYQQRNLEETEDIFSTTEYRNAFYKQLLGQKLTVTENQAFKRAMEVQELEHRTDSFTTTTDTAAVLPTNTLNEIVKKARTMGGLMNEVRAFNMPTNIRIPIGTPGTKAQWHTEGAPVDTEKFEANAFVEFKGYEIIKIFSISAKVSKMTISAFESYLVEELTNCVMETIASSLIDGTGVEQGKGLLTGVTWNADNSINEDIAYTTFTKALGKLKRGYSSNAKWAMNNATLYNTVYSLVDGNKRPIFISDPKSENIGHILGKQVIIDDYLPDDTILLGDFKYMAYNLPQGVMLEVSRESSFKSGLIDYRALAIADTQPLVDEAFIKIGKATASK